LLIDGGWHNFTMSKNPDFLSSEERVLGNGMPISKTPGERGDLLIRTNIQLPSIQAMNNMTHAQKSILIECFN
jgi:DnaJ-class molecular chaperone